MPAAFVTGGTGFLGLNLIEQLLAQSSELSKSALFSIFQSQIIIPFFTGKIPFFQI